MGSEPGDADSPFRTLCETQNRRLEDFRYEYPDLEEVFGACFQVAWRPIQSISASGRLSSVETHQSMMWQTVFNYQTQASLLITTRNTDAGLALIRLASELARDVSVLANDRDRLDIWLNRRDRGAQAKYRKMFRFDDDNSFGRAADDAYDLCSEFGVHGHTTDSMHLQVTGIISGVSDDPIFRLKVSDSAMLGAVQIWLAAFGALHYLCAETFLPRHHSLLADPIRGLLQLIDGLGPVIEAISQRLKELKAKGGA